MNILMSRSKELLNINLVLEQIPLTFEGLENVEVIYKNINIKEVMDKTVWTRSMKRITMNKNVIGNVVKYCLEHVDVDARGKAIKKRTANGGYYYALITEMAIAAGETVKGGYPEGLPCYDCREMILNGEECISCSKSNGKKYLHPLCAYRRNII